MCCGCQPRSGASAFSPPSSRCRWSGAAANLAWDRVSEWDVVVELNGRWREGAEVTHQVTAGLQWIHQRYVLEAGVVQDLNGPESTQFVSSARFHL